MPTAPALRSARVEARNVAGWAALGLGAGALSGLVVGGVGGRLAMLVLRRESPGARGLTSDAGFEIGRVTLSGTLELLTVTVLLGAVGGLAYVAVRGGLPAAARIPAAALVGATGGGSAFIEPDGIDLLVLGPLWFAITAFIALPAVAAAVAAGIVEWRVRDGHAPVVAAAWPGRPSWAAPVTRVVVCLLVLTYVVVQGTELITDVNAVR